MSVQTIYNSTPTPILEALRAQLITALSSGDLLQSEAATQQQLAQVNAALARRHP